MEEAARSGADGEQGRAAGMQNATPRSSPATAHRRPKDYTPAEREAALIFMDAAIEDLHVYMAMTEDDVEEEYRRAGKLHRYDPEMELKKRYARVAKKYPPPEGFVPKMPEYMKLIEDEDE